MSRYDEGCAAYPNHPTHFQNHRTQVNPKHLSTAAARQAHPFIGIEPPLLHFKGAATQQLRLQLSSVVVAIAKFFDIGNV